MFKVHQLHKGRLVELRGLVSRPEKNGLVGRLLDFNATSGRWGVRIQSNGEELSVKADNLWVLTEECECEPTTHKDQVLRNSNPLLNSAPAGRAVRGQMGYESCDVAMLQGGQTAQVVNQLPIETFRYYNMVNGGQKAGALSLDRKGLKTPPSVLGGYRPTGHGLVLRGLVSIPSPLGYIEGVRLFEEKSKQFVAVSAIHRQAVLILCGAEALARLEECKMLDISAWITTGAKILPIRLPLQAIAYLHDWVDIEPERPAGLSRAAYYECAAGQYFFRAITVSINAGEIIGDDNTEALTAADDLSLINTAEIIAFGPVPIDWEARGCPPPDGNSDVMYSDDTADLLISELSKRMMTAEPGDFEDVIARLAAMQSPSGQASRAAPPGSPESQAPTPTRRGAAPAEGGAAPKPPPPRAAGASVAGQALIDQAEVLEFDRSDLRRALEVYQQAAAAGNPRGMAKVGWALLTGAGGTRMDRAEGERVTRRAAELGDAMAQSNLASCLLEAGAAPGGGDAHGAEMAEAAEWYGRSAAQGFAYAEYNLGVLVEKGWGGLRRDEAAAVELFRRSADKNEGGGHYHLGRMYEMGRGGLARDMEEAIRHYQLAAAKGFPPAVQVLAAGGLRDSRPGGL